MKKNQLKTRFHIYYAQVSIDNYQTKIAIMFAPKKLISVIPKRVDYTRENAEYWGAMYYL